MLRVQLPDRPGSLGAVATAMGTQGADISAIEIVERGVGFAINDFMLSMPPGSLPDSLVSACNSVEGVRVLWLSRYPASWGVESDIDTIDRMANSPERALEVLIESAPRVFHCQWALCVDENGDQRARTDLAPDVDVQTIAALGGHDEVGAHDLPEGWLPGWGDTSVAVMPVRGEGFVALGRSGGPAFLASELRRLQHLVSLAH
ncbi:ACT domain-containing protein [Aestuariimicrobium ganziense]|uniref:amino acid-binding protein n=1 Tax=Aestuariimicrobium ganziense TaxID=2773677 RepID=UPI001940B088|nr:amino acid-binding protein [Aestuariimicrobium ganziense]